MDKGERMGDALFYGVNMPLFLAASLVVITLPGRNTIYVARRAALTAYPPRACQAATLAAICWQWSSRWAA